MKELLDKISSYNLFNYLLPGILFAVLSREITTYSFLQENLIIGVFVCYFIGLVVSRIGSLIIEPILRKLAFLNFADYKDFIAASQKDSKIELLSEFNNMYRPLTSLFILLVLLKVYELIESKLPILTDWNSYILLALLLFIFLFSYRKQTTYIIKRIKSKC
ncbi:MAG: hypothetical protein HZA13_00405 [Nitrospirae bacterium]|nr:hypothetical protein [Nitrospirota bacterium]